MTISTEDLTRMAEGRHVFGHKDGLALATEILAARANLEAAEKLADALSDFATAKIDALHFPGVIRSPEDEPDPVVEADYVWALQDDAKTALAAWEAAQ